MVIQWTTYKAIAWWQKTLKDRATSKLASLQRIASLGMVGAISSIPSFALEALLDLAPLEIVIENETNINNGYTLMSVWSTSRAHLLVLPPTPTGLWKDQKPSRVWVQEHFV